MSRISKIRHTSKNAVAEEVPPDASTSPFKASTTSSAPPPIDVKSAVASRSEETADAKPTFPATPLRSFCEEYASVENKQKVFLEERNRKRDLVASLHGGSARAPTTPSGGQKVDVDRCAFGGPPTFWAALRHLVIIALMMYAVCYFLNLT